MIPISLFILIIGVFLIIILSARFYNMKFTRSVAAGIFNGELVPCSHKPNCVGSMNEVGEKYLAPIVLNKNQDWYSFIQLVSTQKQAKRQAKLIISNNKYAHFEFTSPVMGYIDDVEFLLDNRKQEIHFRSSSRVGYSDMGANRKRMEWLRTLLK